MDSQNMDSQNMDSQNNNVNEENIKEDNEEKRNVGIVKWFSNKLGYGFITYSDNNNVSHDVFVHHTSIKPRRTSYRTLTMGEYVEFALAELKNNNQKQAINITGPANGPLLSDSVNEFRTNYRNTHSGYNNNRQIYNERPTYNSHNSQEMNKEIKEIVTEDKDVETKTGMVPIKKSSIIACNNNTGDWSQVVRKARREDKNQ